MPITSNAKIIKKYVPEKSILGSSVEVDNSGYLLQRDIFISIFPSIMEYTEVTPFGDKAVLLKFNWCAYIINGGIEVLVISSSDKFSTLESAVKASDFDLWSMIPPWYLIRMYEKEEKVCANIWKAYMEKDIVLYSKLQNEYGYILGEAKSEKTLIFPTQKMNTNHLLETLSIILKDKVLRGELTKDMHKKIIEQYAKKYNQT